MSVCSRASPQEYYLSLVARMVGVSWATVEQNAFLTARLDQFIAAQTQRNLISFYSLTCHDFFERWSERERLYPAPASGEAPTLTPTDLKSLATAIVKRKSVSIHIYSYSTASCYSNVPTADQVMVLMALKADEIQALDRLCDERLDSHPSTRWPHSSTSRCRSVLDHVLH